MRRFQKRMLVVVCAVVILTAGVGWGKDPFYFGIKYEWVSYPTVTLRKAAAKDKVVVSIDIAHFPVRRMANWLGEITEQRNVKVASVKMCRFQGPAKQATVHCTLEPIDRGATGDVLHHLREVLKLRSITIDASMATGSREQFMELLMPSAARRKFEQLQKEVRNAVDDALPRSADESGWKIELHGYHFDRKQRN